jgi:hypothetical protein
MKHLRTLLLTFSLAAAGVILATALRIYDDYQNAVIGAHAGDRGTFPHGLDWLVTCVFVLSALIALIAYFLLFNLPYNWREPSFILAGIGLLAMAFQPISWSLGNNSDANGTAFWRSIWLICEASVMGLSFFIFCYRRLRGNHRPN